MAIEADSPPRSPITNVLLPPAPNDNIVTLQVGERIFHARLSTLTEKSSFFTSQLAERWHGPQPKEPLFIDSDPDIFQHTLRYLRNHVFPVFYTKAQGHDYGMYNAVLEQARFFGLEGLRVWIEEKKYLKAVTILRLAARIQDADLHSDTTNSNVEVESQTVWKTKKVYVCPRAIMVHTDPSHCGKLCRRELGDEEDEYRDEEYLSTVEIRTEVLFDHEMCIDRD